MRRIILLFTVATMMAVLMSISAGPASADDWDHNRLWDDGCWEWSWVFEKWKYECDDNFWWERDHHNDFGIFVKDFDRHDKRFDRHDTNRHRNHGGKWDWRD